MPRLKAAREEAFRAHYHLRYDDPDRDSLLAFLVEGLRLAESYPPLQLWRIEVQPDDAPSIRNWLTEHNKSVEWIDGHLRQRALAMLADAGLRPTGVASDEAIEKIVANLIDGVRYLQIAVGLSADNRKLAAPNFSPAARAIAATCMLLQLELGSLKPTPLYDEAASLLNAGIPLTRRGLAGRHIRAGSHRWQRDVLAAVNGCCVRSEKLVEIEFLSATTTIRSLLVLWSQAPSVARFQGYRGAALAREIDNQDGITFRISKACGKPLRLRGLYDCQR